MNRHVDVAVIGAGHAGLNAIKEIRKVTENYVLINGGQLGTTCARCGCMPSKVALHLAEVYNDRTQYRKLESEVQRTCRSTYQRPWSASAICAICSST